MPTPIADAMKNSPKIHVSEPDIGPNSLEGAFFIARANDLTVRPMTSAGQILGPLDTNPEYYLVKPTWHNSQYLEEDPRELEHYALVTLEMLAKGSVEIWYDEDAWAEEVEALIEAFGELADKMMAQSAQILQVGPEGLDVEIPVIQPGTHELYPGVTLTGEDE